MSWFGSRPLDGIAVGFGYKGAWLAIRAAAAEPVIAALPIEKVKPCGWRKGIEAAYKDGLFVTPPIDGWVLVVSKSNWLPVIDEDPVLAMRLSRELGTVVQCFSTHRVVEYHAWAWIEGGEVRRVYTFADDEVLFDVRSADDHVPPGPTFEVPHEDTVMELAAAWSLDPRELDGREVGPGWTARWRRA